MFIKEINSKFQTTLILVTHDQNEAMTFTEIIIVKDSGQTVQSGVCQQSCPFFSRSFTQFLLFRAYLFRRVQPYLSDRTPISDFA